MIPNILIKWITYLTQEVLLKDGVPVALPADQHWLDPPVDEWDLLLPARLGILLHLFLNVPHDVADHVVLEGEHLVDVPSATIVNVEWLNWSTTILQIREIIKFQHKLIEKRTCLWILCLTSARGSAPPSPRSPKVAAPTSWSGRSGQGACSCSWLVSELVWKSKCHVGWKYLIFAT